VGKKEPSIVETFMKELCKEAKYNNIFYDGRYYVLGETFIQK